MGKVKSVLPNIVCAGWMVFACYALIYRSILIGQYFNIIPAIFAIIIGLVVRKNCRIRTNVVAVIVLLFGYYNLVGMMLFNYIDRREPWAAACYGIDIKYINSAYHTNYDFLPEKLPSDAHNLSFILMPTLLQGGGHTNVFFKTSDENIEQYIAYYQEQAILPPFTVSELYDQDNSPVLSHLGDYVEDVSEPKLHISIPEYVRKNYPDAEVYVIYSNFNWNHMYSNSFILDKEAGIVGFTVGG